MSGALQPVKRIYRCIIALSARQRYTNHTKNKILSRQFGNFTNGQGGAADRYAIMISNPRDQEKKGERKE